MEHDCSVVDGKLMEPIFTDESMTRGMDGG